MVYYSPPSQSSSVSTNEQSDKDKALIENYLKKHEAMSLQRVNWETNWQEVLEHCVPRKGDVTTKRLQGDKRGNELFDSTAITATELLAGELHGRLTNPSIRFFELLMGDPELSEDEEVTAWLQDTADRMYLVLNNSNFQTETHEIYIDLASIGTACLFMGEHDEKIVHFSARAMKEIYISEDNLGGIDTVHRLFEWTPRQIVLEFGEDKVPEYVLKKYKEGCEDKWKILHVVEPKDKSEDGVFAFRSCYVLFDERLKISEGGFREFPYAVPRWTKTSGEIYGRGPGMQLLPDIKMVNKMMETTLRGAQKTVDPPLMIADDGVIGRVRLTPGGLTVVRPGSDVPIRPLITDARIDFGYQAVEDVRRRIREGFYIDQLQLAQGPQMTATEVMQRTENKLSLMGPVLGRQNFEYLRPIIERVFPIMYRRGLLMEPPRQIMGKKFDVRYSSMIARAQRMGEGQSFTRAISVAAPIIQMDQSVIDNIDMDKSLKYILDIHGVPVKLLRPSQDVEQLRESRAQAQAQVAKEEQEMHQAEVVSKTAPGAAQLAQASNQQGE